MTKKLLAATGGIAAAVALAVPGQANAAPAPSNTLLKVKLQVLQPATGCALLGTNGTILLGTPVELCI